MGLRYESARRRGSEWTITILQEVQGIQRRTTCRIDPSTRFVKSMRMEVLAAAPLGSTTEARLTNLTVAPERPESSPAC